MGSCEKQLTIASDTQTRRSDWTIRHAYSLVETIESILEAIDLVVSVQIL
jgi:hypothetical protein